ncbi:polymerase [Chitinophaga sp. Cy-1792]|uniref:polymerase n=1 Tax=Chitinophaga sp. Cy-1792 TaxID=2608339 RepID=UPI00141F7FB5|nr:polymerase [Chitinophaga sp. Cy-1792]NIG56222.1 polymerase [Chitinophaga sp. Cy-1792]
MLRKLIAVALLTIVGTSASAQQDTVKNQQASLFGQSDTVLHKRSFFPLPVLTYSQEKGLEIGAAMLYSFYTDRKNPSAATRNSTINLIPGVTTKNQYKVDLKADIWTRDNIWHFRGSMRYQNFPLYFYGIGDTTHAADKSLLNNVRFRFQGEAERKVGSHFYVGATMSFQNDTYSSDDGKGIYNTMPLVGKTGGHVTFVGLTGIYDTRDNQNYTRKGTWLRLNTAFAPSFLSSEQLWKIEAQGKQFVSLSRKSTLGFNAFFNSLQGSQLPFYLLPEMGNDNLMRGYYSGRYRNQNYLAFQTEYRYLIDPKVRIKVWFVDLHPKFALAAFAGTGTVFANRDFHFDGFKPNYGGGIRYFYDENSRLTVRIDYGVGEKRPGEARQKGLYLSLAEAF